MVSLSKVAKGTIFFKCKTNSIVFNMLAFITILTMVHSLGICGTFGGAREAADIHPFYVVLLHV